MLRFGKSALVAILAVMAMVAAPLVHAEAGDYTSTSTGRVVSWDAGWSEEQTEDSGNTTEDSVSIVHGDSGAELSVVFVPQSQDSAQVRDEIVSESGGTEGTVSAIEQGSYGDVEYQVDLLRADESETEGVFTLKMSDPAAGTAVVYVLVTQVENFSAGVSAVQVGVKIDGGVAMDGVDPSGMQSFLQLAQSTSTQTGDGSEIALPTSEPTAETVEATEAPANTGSLTYTNSAWGYTVEYDSVFMDITDDSGSDLMLASPSPLLVVGFQGLENPGATPAVIFEALMPTFVDSLGEGGSYIDGGYSEDRAYWSGVTSDGLQMFQQLVVISPGTVVIVTMIGEPGVPMNSAGEITLNGISVFGN